MRGISDIIQLPGLVNVDFADVKTIMANAGTALMGKGVAKGKGRAAEAARAALSSPLLDVEVGSATGIVWNITGPSDMTLFEVNAAAEAIYNSISPETNIIFGAGESTGAANAGEVTVTLIATGIVAETVPAPLQPQQRAAAMPRGSTGTPRAPMPAPTPPAPRERGGFPVPRFLRRR